MDKSFETPEVLAGILEPETPGRFSTALLPTTSAGSDSKSARPFLVAVNALLAYQIGNVEKVCLA